LAALTPSSAASTAWSPDLYAQRWVTACREATTRLSGERSPSPRVCTFLSAVPCGTYPKEENVSRGKKRALIAAVVAVLALIAAIAGYAYWSSTGSGSGSSSCTTRSGSRCATR